MALFGRVVVVVVDGNLRGCSAKMTTMLFHNVCWHRDCAMNVALLDTLASDMVC